MCDWLMPVQLMVHSPGLANITTKASMHVNTQNPAMFRCWFFWTWPHAIIATTHCCR